MVIQDVATIRREIIAQGNNKKARICEISSLKLDIATVQNDLSETTPSFNKAYHKIASCHTEMFWAYFPAWEDFYAADKQTQSQYRNMGNVSLVFTVEVW